MQCEALKEDGTRCRCNFGLDPDGLCWHHSKMWADQRRRAMSQGGKATAARRRKFAQRTLQPSEAEPVTSPEEATELASWVTWAMLVGVVDRHTGREVLNGVKVYLAAREKTELEAKLAELGEQVAELKRLRAV